MTIRKNKALFLDRDGVVNVDYGYVHSINDFKFTPWIFGLCKIFQQLGYLIFIVTNQSGVARGYFSEDDYMELTRHMLENFEQHGIHISDVQQCFELNSFFRKPNPGMFLELRDKWNIDMRQSIAIGDKHTDKEAAEKAGIELCITINYKGNDNT